MSTHPQQAKKPEQKLIDADLQKKWEHLDQYQLIRKSNDPRFGEITILKDKSQIELIFSKEKVVSSKDQAFLDIHELRARDLLKHPNIQKFLGYSCVIDKQLCTTNYVTCGYYKFPKADLSKEIQDKAKGEAIFKAHELHFMLMNALHGLEYLHSKNIAHGDLRPMYIGYNKEKGELILMDRLNDPSPIEKVQRNNLTLKKEVYLSPELYSRIQGKNNNQKYNPFKNDTWAIGLIFLQAGLKQSVQDIYEVKGTINHSILKGYLDKFDKLYLQTDHRLSNVIHGLLNEDETKRFDSSLVHKNVSPHHVMHSGVIVNSSVNPSGDSSISSEGKGILVTVIKQDGTPYSYIQSSEGRNVVYDANVEQFKDSGNASILTSNVQGNVGYLQYQRGASLSPVPGVEIRKGSTTPNKGENKLINKSYVLEGDNLKEVENKEKVEPLEVTHLEVKPTDETKDQTESLSGPRNPFVSEENLEPKVSLDEKKDHGLSMPPAPTIKPESHEEL